MALPNSGAYDSHAAFYRSMVRSSVKEYREAMETTSNDSTRPTAPEAAELEEATRMEFGVSIGGLYAILGAVVNSPFTSDSGIAECDKSELLTYLASDGSLDKAVLASALELLTLGPRTGFLHPEEPYGRADVYPWRFNRGLSYLRRPLVAAGTKLLWGRRALRQALGYLVDLCRGGRLKNARTQEMRRYLGKMSNRLGNSFNERVAELLSRSGRFVVRRKVKKISGRRLTRANGELLGDVDVLAADPTTRRILSIEAKCFSLAKTPADLANERDELFGDLETRVGAVGRHLERTEWLRTHVSDVLKELRVNSRDSEGWSVVPFLIVDSDVISARLFSPPFPVVSIEEMQDRL